MAFIVIQYIIFFFANTQLCIAFLVQVHLKNPDLLSVTAQLPQSLHFYFFYFYYKSFYKLQGLTEITRVEALGYLYLEHIY
jgi:hypothetical protein